MAAKCGILQQIFMELLEAVSWGLIVGIMMIVALAIA